ncbi:hypothetical protein T3H97_25580 [Paenibacillus sp. LX16]|nr:hypothetical protein [Paenibacillus sp. LX16]
MPTTKKENFYFGLMMCLGMVVFMTLYNLYTNDLIGTISLKVMVFQFISKKVFVILSLSCCMVIGMVLCMSLYGLGTAYFFNGQILIVGPLVRYLFAKFVKGTRISVSLS